MRSLFLFASLMMLALPAGAQDATAVANDQAVQQEQVEKTEIITILGRNFEVTPYREEAPSQSWEAVRSFLPEDITKSRKEAMSNLNILVTLENQSKAAATKYEALLAKYAAEEAKKHPDQSYDAVELDLAANALGGNKDLAPPDLVQAASEYQAISYLSTMVYQAIQEQNKRAGLAPKL